MNKKFLFIVVILLLAASLWLVGGALAQQPVDVAVTVKEFTVEMSQTTLPANTPITFNVTSSGTIVHEVVLEKSGVVDEPLEIDGEAAEIEDIDPGQTKSATWTISEPGKYQLACHTPGHYEGGMFLEFEVKAPGGGLFSQPLTWILGGGGILLLVVIGIMVMRRPANKNAAAM